MCKIRETVKGLTVFGLIVSLLFSSFSLSGCMNPNKPNIPFPNPISEINFLQKRNPLLAKEIKKLPEIKDGIDKADRIALQRLSELYRTEQSAFDNAFKKMYKIGLPEHRRYCSPLQALFWIAMVTPFSKDDNPIKSYSLISLLDEAWTFAPKVSAELLNKMLNAINDPKVRKRYSEIETNKYLIYSLLSLVKYSPEKIEEWVPVRLKKMQDSSLWNDYDVVIDRLNSPLLVDYYVKKQISYSNYWEIPSYNSRRGNPHYVFRNKRGDCLYISTFIARALQKNGYQAWVEKMPPHRPVDSFHAVCVYKFQGDKYIIDDGKMRKRGIVEYDHY